MKFNIFNRALFIIYGSQTRLHISFGRMVSFACCESHCRLFPQRHEHFSIVILEINDRPRFFLQILPSDSVENH